MYLSVRGYLWLVTVVHIIMYTNQCAIMLSVLVCVEDYRNDLNSFLLLTVQHKWIHYSTIPPGLSTPTELPQNSRSYFVSSKLLSYHHVHSVVCVCSVGSLFHQSAHNHCLFSKYFIHRLLILCVGCSVTRLFLAEYLYSRKIIFHQNKTISLDRMLELSCDSKICKFVACVCFLGGCVK